MRDSEEQRQIRCEKCHNFIKSTHYSVHNARCNGPSRRSRIFQNNHQVQPPKEDTIPCSFCSYPQTFSELDTHPNECPSREVECQQCHQNYPVFLLEQHQELCPQRRRRVNHNLEQNPFMPFLRHVHSNEDRRHEQPGMMSLHEMIRPILEGGFEGRHRNEGMMSNENHVLAFNSMGQLPLLIEFLANRQRGSNTQRLSKREIDEMPTTTFKLKKEEEPEVCTVCYCEFEEGEKVMILPCKHLFHPECVAKWLQRNDLCPVCKQSCKRK